MDSWAPITAAVISALALFYLVAGPRKRRPTQHDLDPTLKKNQVRITTQKKAFRRDELPPEYLAMLERKDIVELPMGAPRPTPPQDIASATDDRKPQDDWLPEGLKKSSKKIAKQSSKK